MFHQVTYKLLQFLEFLLAICLVLQALQKEKQY